MKIENLKLFIEVANTGSINKAAENTFTSHQNLGHAIRSLEKELGKQLLVRHNKGVELTSDGERFFHYAQQIVAPYDEYMDTERKRSAVYFYTTPSLAMHLTGLYDTVLQGKYRLSIRTKTANELQVVMGQHKQGLYFLPLTSDRATLLQHGTVIATDTTVVQACHKTNPLVGDDGVIPNSAIYTGTESFYMEHFLNDIITFVNTSDISICKKLMRENHYFYMDMKSLFQISFSESHGENEWMVLRERSCDPLHYCLMSYQPNRSDQRVFHDEIAQKLKDIFHVI